MKKFIFLNFYICIFLISIFSLNMPDWLKLNEDIVSNWQSQYNPNTPFVVTIYKKSVKIDKTIFVLFSKKSSAYNTSLNKIISVLSDKNINIKYIILNYSGDKELGFKAFNLAKQNKVDLFFAMGSKAAGFCFKQFHNPPMPVLSVCAKDPVMLGQMKDYETGSGTNFAFTSLNVPIELQLNYIRQLIPDVKNIAILYAKQNSSAVKTQVVPLEKIAKKEGINILHIEVQEQKNSKAELSVLVPQVVVKLKKSDPNLKNSIFWVTGSTSVFKEIETINKFANKVPVLSAVTNVVKPGDNSALLSIGVSFESNAHIAAIYAYDILANGIKPGTLKVGVVTPPDIAINFKKSREIELKIPFLFFESAGFIYGYNGETLRLNGEKVKN